MMEPLYYTTREGRKKYKVYYGEIWDENISLAAFFVLDIPSPTLLYLSISSLSFLLNVESFLYFLSFCSYAIGYLLFP